MNIDELEKAVRNLRAMGPAARENPAIAKTVEKLRKQLLKKGGKEILDNSMLKSLVYLIEIAGRSQKQSFKKIGGIRGYSESRAKKLWYDTVEHNPEKVEDLRQYHAYRLTSDLAAWMKGERIEPCPETHTLVRLMDKEPALWHWATTMVFLDVEGIKHRDFKPNYKKPVDVLEKDLLSFQKEIASSD